MKHILHGRQPVLEALAAKHPIERLYLSQRAKGDEIQRIKTLAHERRVPYDFVPPVKLDALAQSREHQGVVAIVGQLSYIALDEWLDEIERDGEANVLVLAADQVQNPKNLGMLVRTAAAAGARGVLVPIRGGATMDMRAIRASAGTAFRIPIVKCSNLAQALRKLKETGFYVYGLSSKVGADIFRVDWARRTVLVVGSEHAGLRPVIEKTCDERVRIALAPGVDSLNVVVAAGIALFQARQSVLAADSTSLNSHSAT